jgi:glycosyltransferase involved in cell wall biosynthesis
MNYETPYWQEVQAAARGNPRVRFLGGVYGPMKIETLHLGAFGYLHGHHAGGTNPALVKAMACGNACFANETVYSREVLSGTGLLWSRSKPGSLAEQITWAEAHTKESRALGKKAQDRARDHYNWDKIAQGHDEFFRRLGRERGLPV